MIRRDDFPSLRVLFGRFMRPHLARIALASCLGLCVASLTTIQPLVLAPIVDTATSAPPPAGSWSELTLNNVGATLMAWIGQEGRTWRVVFIAACAYFALVLLSSVLSYLNLLIISRVRTLLFRDLQETGYRHLLGLDLSFFAGQRTGDLAARLNHDTHRVAQSAELVLRGLLQSGFQLVLTMVVLVRTNVVLTGAVTLAFAAHFLITRLLRDRVRHLVVRQSTFFGEVAGRVHEAIAGIRTVKSFAGEAFELGRFREHARRLESVMIRDGVYKNLERPLRDLADAGGLVVVLLMAFSAYLSNHLTLSGFVLFVALARRALEPAARLAESILLLQTTLGSAGRLLPLLEATPQMADGTLDTPPLSRGIQLDRVNFSYGSKPVLKDVSCDIRRGQFVALVGPSGSGKSTLIDLILRLDDPSSGAILWDGVSLQNLKQHSYRRRFGVVPQDALIFTGTVAENIAYGRGIDAEAIRRAARIAQVDTFASALPRGYDTELGDRGVGLSGGERQRLAIARALYANPDVLVLDEATSALDAETEAALQQALAAMNERPTVMVVAHRLSTVVRADRIFLLDAGRIQASGTHSELLAGSRLYERMYEQQLQAVPDTLT